MGKVAHISFQERNSYKVDSHLIASYCKCHQELPQLLGTTGEDGSGTKMEGNALSTVMNKVFEKFTKNNTYKGNGMEVTLIP